MNETQLDRAIKSVGKTCFVNYFENFRDFSQTIDNLVEILVREKEYAETASRTRVTYARNIIRDGHAEEILIDITKSGKLDDEAINKAKDLLRRYYS
jgi:hypothetical protein